MELVPARWQAYSRTARLLLKTQQFGPAVKMVNRAYARIKEDGSLASVDSDASARYRQLCAELETIKASALRGLNDGRDIIVRPHQPSCYTSELPTELLTEIFTLVTRRDPTAIARTLIRVCRRWRQVALNCPALWDILVLGASESRREPRKRAKAWLRLSKGEIHDLRVFENAVMHDDWRKKLEEELKSLKWSGLRALTIQLWDIVGYLTSISSQEILGTLEKLTIVEDSSNTTSRWDSLLSATRQVTEMHLNGVRFNPRAIASRILRRLVIERCNYGDHHALEFFELQPFIETLIISQTVSVRPWHYTKPIHLNYLTHMDVSKCYMMSLENLFVPNLRVLRLFQSGTLIPPDLRHLASMHLTNFEELSLSQVIYDTKTLIEFLETVPTLKRLELKAVQGSVTEVIEALAEPRQSGDSTSEARLPCPRLEHLDVSDTPDIKSATLVRLVKSRFVDVEEDHAVTRIQSLKMDGCPRIEPDILPWFRQHVPVVSCIYLSKKARIR
jgi:F-box/TPR repeat protein Pof3